MNLDIEGEFWQQSSVRRAPRHVIFKNQITKSVNISDELGNYKLLKPTPLREVTEYFWNRNQTPCDSASLLGDLQ